MNTGWQKILCLSLGLALISCAGAPENGRSPAEDAESSTESDGSTTTESNTSTTTAAALSLQGTSATMSGSDSISWDASGDFDSYELIFSPTSDCDEGTTISAGSATSKSISELVGEVDFGFANYVCAVGISGSKRTVSTNSSLVTLVGSPLASPTEIGVEIGTPQVESMGGLHSGSLALDGSGNLYIGGISDELVLSGTIDSDDDVFIRKVDNTGALVTTGAWSTHAFDDNFDDERIGQILIDGSDNVYMVAVIEDGSFDTLTIRKYSSAGVEDTTNWGWKTTFGAGAVYENDIHNAVMDSSGNIYIALTLQNHAHLVKINSDGSEDVSYRKRIKDEETYWTTKIAMDASDNLYVAGAYYVTASNRDIFIKKYDSAGNNVALTVETQNAGSSTDSLEAIAVGTTYFYIGTGNGRIYQFDLNGNAQGNITQSSSIEQIVVDSSGNFYAAGTQSSNGYVRKYDSSRVEDLVNFPFIYNTARTEQFNDIIFDGTDLFIAGSSYFSSELQYYVKKISQTGVEDGAWAEDVTPLRGHHDSYTIGHVLSNGTIIAVGATTNLVNTSSSDDYYMRGYNPDGSENASWRNQYDTEAILGMHEDAHGDLFVVGVETSVDSDGLIRKYQADGTSVGSWTISIPDSGGSFEICYDAVTDASDNLYVLCRNDDVISGTSNNDAIVHKFASNAVQDGGFSITFDDNDKYENPQNIYITKRNELIITGESLDGSTSNTFWARAYSLSGSLIWEASSLLSHYNHDARSIYHPQLDRIYVVADSDTAGVEPVFAFDAKTGHDIDLNYADVPYHFSPFNITIDENGVMYASGALANDSYILRFDRYGRADEYHMPAPDDDYDAYPNVPVSFVAGSSLYRFKQAAGAFGGNSNSDGLIHRFALP